MVFVPGCDDLDGSRSSEDADDVEPLVPDADRNKSSEDTTFAATGSHSIVSSTGDSGSDAGATTESLEPPNCNPEAPFGRPFAITAINLDGEREEAMVAPDGLTIYVRYGDEATTYASTREDIRENFGSPHGYSGFDNLLTQDSTLQLRSITADGLTVYLSTVELGASVQSSDRSVITDSFSQLIVHEELAVQLSLADPWVTPNGTRVYGYLPAAYTFWMAARGEGGFVAPIQIISASSETIFHGMGDFTLSHSELILYFVASGLGEEYFENGAIARAERSSVDTDFGNWEVLSALDSPAYAAPLWVSDDDCEIILTQESRETSSESSFTSDLYIARRGM